ncbi:MAG TPA: M20/M25/M40 family metallo-hydrolase, partial [Candidatus Limnocylindrales bacterium]|nr:M20/M25/M40 family metallo-hydrolase [Candidatus Limnocylindrales bacterium]
MVFWMFAGLIALWLALILIRAALHKPYPGGMEAVPLPVLKVDHEKAAEHLSAMIRCRTVSYVDPGQMDFAEFDKLRLLLGEMYPETHKKLDHELISGHALLYRWKGRSDAKPMLLMAHYDVVPAAENQWRFPPFSGNIADGAVWGRGALDMKSTLCGILEAVEALVTEGFRPAEDIYLAFSYDEETMGIGAPAVVETLKSRGIRMEMVLDEGGAVINKVFPGVKKPVALVGLSEKGVADIECVVTSRGGHASTPGRYNPLGVMSSIITRVGKKPFRAHLPAETREMFEVLSREMPFVYRILFANLWFFRGLLTAILPKLSGETNAMCRSTCVFTMAEGSRASNVLPDRVRTVANLRLAAIDSVEHALRHIIEQTMIASKKAITANKTLSVKVNLIHGHEASPSSTTTSDAYGKLSEAIRAVYPEAV